jgi:hypothetical protein
MTDTVKLLTILETEVDLVCGVQRRPSKDIVRAVLAELDRQGWACVPKVADMDMRIAARDDIEHGGPDAGHWAWLSMVAAAPKLVEDGKWS